MNSEKLNPSICMDEWFNGMSLPRNNRDIVCALQDMVSSGDPHHPPFDRTGTLRTLFYNLMFQRTLPGSITEHLSDRGIPRLATEFSQPSQHDAAILRAQARITPELDEAFKREIARGRMIAIVSGLEVVSTNLFKKHELAVIGNDPIRAAGHRSYYRDFDSSSVVERIVESTGVERHALVHTIQTQLHHLFGDMWGLETVGRGGKTRLTLDWKKILAADAA